MSTCSDLVIIKLGGSLITDKRGDAAARMDVIERLAQEIASVHGEIPQRIVLGHGSGSYGHVAAQQYDLGRGLRRADGSSPVIGAAITQDVAAQLHRLVIGTLVQAGVPAFSIAPSSAFVADEGRLIDGFLGPLTLALEEGLLPVVYGDVVVDRTRGASICSTEMAVDFLVRNLTPRGWPTRRLLWLGETDGIYDREGQTLPHVDGENINIVKSLIDAPAGTDVTGGMLLRLETARSQTRLGIESLIFDGRKPGALAAALRGEEVGGTRVAPDPPLD